MDTDDDGDATYSTEYSPFHFHCKTLVGKAIIITPNNPIYQLPTTSYQSVEELNNEINPLLSMTGHDFS